MIALFVGADGLRVGWGLLLFIVTALCLYVLLLLVVPLDLSSELGLFASEVMLLAGVCVGSALMARVEGRSVWSYGLSGPSPTSRFVSGWFWGVVLLTLLVLGLLASGHLAVESGALPAAESVLYGIAYAVGFFVVALAEEMLFRGYLQATLARLVGFWPAAGLLSLLFGLAHRGNPGESVLGLVAAVLIGGVLSLSLRLSGSLSWAIGFHAAWDWAQSFLWGTPVSGFALQGSLTRSHAVGDPLWSGGATGPEGSLLVLPILALTLLVVVRRFARPGAEAQA